jgi:hypothetical protein
MVSNAEKGMGAVSLLRFASCRYYRAIERLVNFGPLTRQD